MRLTMVFKMSTALVTAIRRTMSGPAKTRYPQISKRIIIIVGGFGSGKTEVAVNLAAYLALSEKTPLSIVDLDLVNPYFRTREAVAEMERLGIRVIAPRGGQFFADLPILLPEVKGAVQRRDGKLILDVGGDAQGARALGSMAEVFITGEYEMWMVLNSRRPQTANADVCLNTMARIENTARLKFTGLIVNSHLLEETDRDILSEGYLLAREVERLSGLPIAFLSADKTLLEQPPAIDLDCPMLPLIRMMLKPWETKAGPADDQPDD